MYPQSGAAPPLPLRVLLREVDAAQALLVQRGELAAGGRRIRVANTLRNEYVFAYRYGLSSPWGASISVR